MSWSMQGLYALAVGPLAWIAFTVFLLGIVVRAWRFFSLARVKDKSAFQDFRPGWAAASVLRYLLPLNRTIKASPWTAVAGFLFHIAFLALALFLSAHVVLWEQAWNVTWPTIPDRWADAATLAALACLAFLAGKRLFAPTWRGLSSPIDFVVLALAALPLLTGFMAHQMWPGYEFLTLLHVLSGEVLLVAIPFTKLSHFLFFFISRALTGSDFGKRQVGAW